MTSHLASPPLSPRRPARARRASFGFTLIELMVVVAVVAILSTIAYPSYQDSVRKSRRGEAKADLLELTQGYERFFTVNNRYEGFGDPLPFTQSPRTGVARYTLAAAVETANTYTITATPVGPQAQDTCGTLSINHMGQKTPADPRCW